MVEIEYNDFKKLEMKVGEIVEVERVPKTDKLYKLQVDIGNEENIQIVTSLVPFYTEEELQNKRIVVLVNLKPTKFAGEKSEGMLLCAEKDDDSECVLLSTEKEIDVGTQVT
jgi:tRNA-binding protein